MQNPTTRFMVHKDAHEYLIKEINIFSVLDICWKDQFELDYNGDPDFKKYFRGNFQKIEEFSKYYEKPELFLQNIYWEAILKNVEKSLIDILSKVTKEQGNDNSLIIINAHPIEMVAMWEILRSFGYMNVVYNFNKNPFPNSLAKTFEACLLFGAWKNSPYFQEQSKKIQINLNALMLKIQGEKTFFLFDENNSFIPYKYTKIDNYIKTQIGYKEPKNIYRLDKYPNIEFLLQKWIKKVIAFDSDGDFGGIIESYNNLIVQAKNWISFMKQLYVYEDIKNPGYYEDYLVTKNNEYATYRQTIEQKTLDNFVWLAEKKKLVESQEYSVINQKNKNNKYTHEIASFEDKDRSLVPYIVLFPIIFIAFIVSDIWVFNTTNNNSGINRSGSHFFYWWGGGGSWLSWGMGSSIGSKSSNSSSIIRSFGGGGFSKGGGG